jgi:hypothetical protein
MRSGLDASAQTTHGTIGKPRLQEQMMALTINIPMPEALTAVYERASDEEKRKAQWLIELVLRDLFREQPEALTEVVRDISQRAGERGMTPDVLDELLADDE